MDISKITDYLYLSSRLQPDQTEELAVRNIGLVISMIGGQRPPQMFMHPPFRLLWLQTCDSLFIPIPMKELIKGVHAVLPVIQNGQNILIYCAKGRHRSVTMAAAVLIARGHTANQAMRLIRTHRMAADSQAWHISRRIYKFEKYWRSKNDQPNQYSIGIEETYAKITTELASNILLFMADTSLRALTKSRNKKVNSI